ncbi:MAG TPA: formimidoylglutamate deiminase [Sphingomonas sp.]
MQDDRGLYFETALLPGGWRDAVRIGVRDGLVATIDIGAAPAATDERHAVALPGLPNLHSHAFQRGMAGLAEARGPSADSFWTWRELMYRFVDRIDPEDLTALAAMAYVEMLESGFTRVGEFHYLHHDRDGRPFAAPAEMSAAIAAAARESGIALTHLPVFYAHAGFAGETPGAAQRRFLHDVDGFARLLDDARRALAALPDAVLGIAPHSLRAVSPGELAALADLAHDGPVHIHIAEQTAEVEACLAARGARPVDWLFDHAPVDARWCLVHATHVTPGEVARIVAARAVVGLCPITEANLGDGLFPAAGFAAAGGRYGVGSDSNVLIDATEELRLLEYGQRLVARGRNMLAGGAGASTGEALYRASEAGGAQALGAAAGIAVGNPADLVSLDTGHASLRARRGGALLDGLVFASGRQGVDCVWRRGTKLVSAGRHHGRDAIAARYGRTLERLLA